MNETGSEQLITLDSSKRPEIKQHFGKSLEIQNIKNLDLIPVGGSSMFSNKLDMEVVADFDNFEDFLKEAHKLVTDCDLVNLRQKLDSKDMDIDEKLFSVIYAFSQKLGEKYFNNPEFYNSDKELTRKKIYKEKNKKTKLSNIFNANSEECVEIAILAQGFLQSEGISSSYFEGEVLWKKEHEFAEPHSFIVVREKGKQYIYDPSNPMINKRFPSIYSTEKDFDKEIAKGQKIFVTAKNIRDKSEAFYGTGDMTAVYPEKHIV